MRRGCRPADTPRSHGLAPCRRFDPARQSACSRTRSGNGRLHLAAYALGIGASGMTFLDSEIHALLGEPLAALLFTCVGVPHHHTKRAGNPRDPTDVSAL
jgi:hypothetical protein